jgi:hypothetical protein
MKTKNRIWLILLIVVGLVLILSNSCKKVNPTQPHFATEYRTGVLTDLRVITGVILFLTDIFFPDNQLWCLIVIWVCE